MSKIYNVTQFSNLIGIKVKTLQKWDRDGILVAYRTPTNRRYYTHAQYLQYIGEDSTTQREDVIYTRVSSRNAKDDLKRQAEFIAEYCHREGIAISNIYSDIGSGLNFNRKDWNRLIDDCMEGKIANIYVSYKDRFIRFGFNWFQSFLRTKFNVNLIVLNDIVTSPRWELLQDLVTIIHMFSSRLPWLKKYQKKIEKEFSENEPDRTNSNDSNRDKTE